MKTGNLTVLILAVVLFVSYPLSAAISDHFNDGVLDSAWNVSLVNATSWNYTESSSTLTVSGVPRTNDSLDSEVVLTQKFSAPGDFEVKSRILWDNKGLDSARNWVDVKLFSGSTKVAWGGYCDYWIADSGQKVARFNYSDFFNYDSGIGTLPYAGSAEFSIIRTNGNIDILWNNQVMLSGYSNLAIDKIGLCFHNLPYYPGGTFGTLSIDYITAVPEPATMILLAIGSLVSLRKRS
jgi:hypothetical protein